MRLICTVGLLFLAACDIHRGHAEKRGHLVTVVEKSYQPDSRSTHVVPTFGMKGKVHFSVVSMGNPEMFVLLVMEPDGKAHSLVVEPTAYAHAQVGGTITEYENIWVEDKP